MCKPGEGEGDCAKHHCFTNAAYDESGANVDVGDDAMLFARSFSASVGDGVDNDAEKAEYEGGGEGGDASDCEEELFERDQSKSYCGALVAGIPPIIPIEEPETSRVIVDGEFEVEVDAEDGDREGEGAA
jgi:hypothetical protein